MDIRTRIDYRTRNALPFALYYCSRPPSAVPLVRCLLIITCMKRNKRRFQSLLYESLSFVTTKFLRVNKT